MPPVTWELYDSQGICLYDGSSWPEIVEKIKKSWEFNLPESMPDFYKTVRWNHGTDAQIEMPLKHTSWLGDLELYYYDLCEQDKWARMNGEYQ